MWKVVRAISVGLWLGYLAKTDWKTKTVPADVLVAGSLMTIFYGVLLFLDNPKSRIAGLCVGVCFLLISRLTKGGIAYVDSWLILVMGFYLGFWQQIRILSVMWFVLTPIAMCYFIRKKCSRKATLPMIPFLALAYLIVGFIQIAGKEGWISKI